MLLTTINIYNKIIAFSIIWTHIIAGINKLEKKLKKKNIDGATEESGRILNY